MARIYIYVEEIKNHGRFRAETEDGTVLVASSNQPLFDAARALQKRGIPPHTTLVMMRRSTGEPSLRGKLGDLVKIRVKELDRGATQFAPFTEFKTTIRRAT